MGQLIDGKKIAEKINNATRQKVVALKKEGVVPKLAVVLIGDDKPSQVYVGRKEKAARELGVDFKLRTFTSDIAKNKLMSELKKIQSDKKLSGLIIQLPLPERLYVREVLNAIKPELDIDYLTDCNLGAVVTKSNQLEPPTASAMLDILRDSEVDLVGKNVVVIGAGVLVGKPLALMLMNERATVTTCNSATKNLDELCKQADIIISCVGKRNLIRGAMVKPGAIVIDAGFVFEDGVISGDVNVNEVLPIASLVTPTPGGVGPVTVAKLLYNVTLSAENLFA